MNFWIYFKTDWNFLIVLSSFWTKPHTFLLICFIHMSSRLDLLENFKKVWTFYHCLSHLVKLLNDDFILLLLCFIPISKVWSFFFFLDISSKVWKFLIIFLSSSFKNNFRQVSEPSSQVTLLQLCFMLYKILKLLITFFMNSQHKESS